MRYYKSNAKLLIKRFRQGDFYAFLMEAYVKHVTRSVGDFGISYNLKQYKLVRYYYVFPIEAYVKHVTKTFDDFGPS